MFSIVKSMNILLFIVISLFGGIQCALLTEKQMEDWIHTQVNGLKTDINSADDYADKMVEMLVAIESNQTVLNWFQEEKENYFKVSPDSSSYISIPPFQCKAINSSQPRTGITVDTLKPSDISIVGAMGDSLTAGTGLLASTIFGLIRQYPGHTSIAGGDKKYEDLVTFPNLLKKWNAKLRGFSTGTNLIYQRASLYNVAKAGSKVTEMPEQARILVDRIRKEESSKYFSDWKMITIMIGGNDLCDFCYDENKYSPANHKKLLMEAIDILYKELPKVFINLVEVIDVSLLQESQHASRICKIIHSWLLCRCVTQSKTADQIQKLHSFMNGYQQAVRDIAINPRYQGRDDFTIVSQPFLRHAKPDRDSTGNLDMSMFAPDCFHLNKKGHSLASLSLWQNMFEKVGSKTTKMSLQPKLYCPLENEYFKTSRNSF